MPYTEYDYLAHHGIKGQRWGIRRYRNYDGSYTQAGLKRYDITKKNLDASAEKYASAKKKYKAGMISKNDLRAVKDEYKKDKAIEKGYYKNLKVNRLADQGKALYNRGVTINDNYNKESLMFVASALAGEIVNDYGGAKAAAIVAGGGIAISLGMRAYHAYQNKRLRAYYSHAHLPMPEDKTSPASSSSSSKSSSKKSAKPTYEEASDRAMEKLNKNLDRLNKKWDKMHPESADRALTDEEQEKYDAWIWDQYDKYVEEFSK